MPLYRFALATVLMLAAPMALAQETDEAPPLPQPRPEGLGEAPADSETEAQTESEAQDPEDTTDPEETSEPEDAPNPETGEIDRVYQEACPALIGGIVIGEMIPPLSEGTCGQQSPIAVSAIVVGGKEVTLSGDLVTNCAMATALVDWAEEVDAYASVALDTELESLLTGPGYQCRLRNNQDTGFVSEHGLGNAVDIASIAFADGTTLSVLDDWQALPASPQAKFLSFAHSAACGRFTTVLGPEANADHEDHFHFDLGCHGQSCTAQICE